MARCEICNKELDNYGQMFLIHRDGKDNNLWPCCETCHDTYEHDHNWQERDSQFTNEVETDVKCSICGMAGSRDNKTGDVWFPAT